MERKSDTSFQLLPCPLIGSIDEGRNTTSSATSSRIALVFLALVAKRHRSCNANTALSVRFFVGLRHHSDIMIPRMGAIAAKSLFTSCAFRHHPAGSIFCHHDLPYSWCNSTHGSRIYSSEMKRLIGPFGTLVALVLLGVVGVCVLGSVAYTRCKEKIGPFLSRFRRSSTSPAPFQILDSARSPTPARRDVSG